MKRIGTTNTPAYRIVVADSRSPRDGSFIERLGSYNPMLDKGHKDRVVLNAERIQHWMKVGARPSDRVARFLHEAGHGPKPVIRETPKKSAPKAKAQEHMNVQGERIHNMERLFNNAAGFTAKDDVLPKRLVTEAAKTGPAKGLVSKLPEMRHELRKLPRRRQTA